MKIKRYPNEKLFIITKGNDSIPVPIKVLKDYVNGSKEELVIGRE